MCVPRIGAFLSWGGPLPVEARFPDSLGAGGVSALAGSRKCRVAFPWGVSATRGPALRVSAAEVQDLCLHGAVQPNRCHVSRPRPACSAKRCPSGATVSPRYNAAPRGMDAVRYAFGSTISRCAVRGGLTLSPDSLPSCRPGRLAGEARLSGRQAGEAGGARGDADGRAMWAASDARRCGAARLVSASRLIVCVAPPADPTGGLHRCGSTPINF